MNQARHVKFGVEEVIINISINYAQFCCTSTVTNVMTQQNFEVMSEDFDVDSVLVVKCKFIPI